MYNPNLFAWRLELDLDRWNEHEHEGSRQGI